MKTIAVIEDNADNRLLVGAILEERYEVVEFESGEGVIEAFRASRPDLVLLDISLPGMDGTQVLAGLRQAGFKDLPVVALTAHAMSGDRQKYLDAGFDEYLTKPIMDERVLFETIARMLSED